MTNVLPETTRALYLKGFRNRLMLVGSLITLCAAGISFLLLLPAYFTLTTVLEELALPASLSTFSDTEERSNRGEAARVRMLLGELAPLASATSTVEVELAALVHKSGSVSVDRILYEEKTGLTLSGVAGSRADMNAFREALRRETKYFSNVSVPVASLLGTEEGRFTITLAVGSVNP